MGLQAEGTLDVDALRERVAVDRGAAPRVDPASCSSRRGCALIHGTGRFKATRTRSWSRPRRASRSSRPTSSSSRPVHGPRVPDFAPVDGERVLTTRQAYPPPEIPTHLVVIGSGVTGVEFTHMFDALGSKVTLVVSRQQVLPIKDAEVAAVLEEAFLDRGVTLLKGARGVDHRRARRRRARRLRRRAGRRGLARGARGRLDPEHRGPRSRRRRASRSTTAATSA